MPIPNIQDDNIKHDEFIYGVTCDFPELSQEQINKISEIFKENALSIWEQGLEAEQDKAKGMTAAFEERTKTMMNSFDSASKIDALDIIEIKERVSEYVTACLEELDFKDFGIKKGNADDIQIENIVISGSRSRGLENENSDLDIVVKINFDFLNDKYIKESALFNILNDEIEPCDLNDICENIIVDINPITEQETGSLDHYLERADEYLREKSVQMKIDTIRSELSDFLPEHTVNQIIQTGMKAQYDIDIEAEEPEQGQEK